MQKSAKNEVFVHFLNFGGSVRLDIAYDGSPKCFSTNGSGCRSCMIIQVCIMCTHCAKIEQKNEVFGYFSSIVVPHLHACNLSKNETSEIVIQWHAMV